MSGLFDGAPERQLRGRRRVTAPLLPGVVQFGGCAAEQVITLTRGSQVWVAAFAPPVAGLSEYPTAYGPEVPADEVRAAVAANWPAWRVVVTHQPALAPRPEVSL